MNIRPLILFALLLAIASAVRLAAQTETINGTINQYVEVLKATDCTDEVVVADLNDPAVNMSLAQGDRVLLIQMKGGLIKSPHDSWRQGVKNAGPVRYYNGAGTFEFATVQSVTLVSGSSPAEYLVVFEEDLEGLYEAGHWGGGTNGAQLVKVKTFNASTTLVNVSGGDVTAKAWDGKTGGVIVLETDATLRLVDDVDASAKGYRGGAVSTAGTLSDRRMKVYPEGNLAGQKGEGIDSLPKAVNAGRGPAGSGGGGGNADAAGGGGGANVGVGGVGGWQKEVYGGNDHRKIGGMGAYAIDYATLGTRAFMGGGGGGGHAGSDGGTATAGAPGGGIVIIRAAKIDGAGGTVKANGGSAPERTSGSSATKAGAGGGGAGGSVFLQVPSYVGTTLIEAMGGDGGGTKNVLGTYGYCYGAGGGAGVVWFSLATLPSGVTYNVDKGGNGESWESFSGAPCNGDGVGHGAVPGEAGAVKYSLVLPGTPLP